MQTWTQLKPNSLDSPPQRVQDPHNMCNQTHAKPSLSTPSIIRRGNYIINLAQLFCFIPHSCWLGIITTSFITNKRWHVDIEKEKSKRMKRKVIHLKVTWWSLTKARILFTTWTYTPSFVSTSLLIIISFFTCFPIFLGRFTKSYKYL